MYVRTMGSSLPKRVDPVWLVLPPNRLVALKIKFQQFLPDFSLCQEELVWVFLLGIRRVRLGLR